MWRSVKIWQNLLGSVKICNAQISWWFWNHAHLLCCGWCQKSNGWCQWRCLSVRRLRESEWVYLRLCKKENPYSGPTCSFGKFVELLKFHKVYWDLLGSPKILQDTKSCYPKSWSLMLTVHPGLWFFWHLFLIGISPFMTSFFLFFFGQIFIFCMCVI